MPLLGVCNAGCSRVWFVCRIVKVHQRADLGDGSPIGQDMLTKGDNNNLDDRGLYNDGQLWLSDQEVIGRTVGCAKTT